MIRPLMPRPKPASRLHPEPERWILDAREVNGLPRRRIRTPGITKRISLPRILLLIHCQVGPNPFWPSPRRNKTIVLAEENPNNRAKARILLPLASMPLLLGRIKIKTRKTYPILSATPASKKVIMPTSVLRRSQKTSVGLDDFHFND